MNDRPHQQVFITQLQQDLADQKVAIVLGTGFSAAVSGGEPTATWRGLLADGLAFIGSLTEDSGHASSFQALLAGSPDTDTLVAVAQWLRSKFTQMPGEFANWLIRTVGQLGIVDTHLSDSLPITSFVLTSNYDNLAAEVLGRQNLIWIRDNAVNEVNRNPERYIFHLHGHYTDPNSVILGGNDYGRLEVHGEVQELLRSTARGHSLVFVGFGGGLEDPNFRRLADWVNENQASSPYRHYILLPDEDLQNFDRVAGLSRRLTAISYGQSHSDLPIFLAGLSAASGVPTYGSRRDSVKNAETNTVETIAQLGDPGGYLQSLGSGIPVALLNELTHQLGPYELLSDFQQRAISLCRSLVDERRSVLFCAVTGTGKTTIARVAINLAICNSSSGLELLPTKALVAQEYAEWGVWEQVWEHKADRRIRIYPASRDYPEFDRPVSRGRYEVAVAIYEKLGVYLVSGRTPLANTRLVVVDELQMLIENSDRAAKLEAILTAICLMPPDVRPAILGLSATMPVEAIDVLRHWLGIDDQRLISSNERPVPLDTYVMDPVGWKIQPDAHMYNLPGKQRPPSPSEYMRHSISERVTNNRATLKGPLPHLPSGELAAALIDSILEADDGRKIICFVPSRTAAVELALAVQALLKRRLGSTKRGSPWVSGRFASPGADADTAQEKFVKLQYSDWPNADDVLRGLREGVAAHSASFTAPLRRLLEDEFRRQDGLLRVLIATDTLAVGVNLPADTVVATSVAGYTGSPRRRRLLSASDLDNKAGRAGRRGQSSRPRGEFYLLVPGASDLQNIEGLSTTDVRSLSTVEGTLREYVSATDRSVKITSRYRSIDEISSLVLQVLCQDGFAREGASWLKRVEKILESLLLVHEPETAQVPEPQQILDVLSRRRLIQQRPNGKLAVTGLGVALCRSSLDLNVATTLERVARLACANAGAIDILWNLCRSHAIQTTTEWVSLPPVPTKHYPSMKEAVLRIANGYCADKELARRNSARLAQAGKYPLPEVLVLEGSEVVSNELSTLLKQDGESASDADVTALLRALVAYEWSRGLPFGQIKARYSSSVTSEEVQRGEAPVSLKLHYADVEQLCEQIAGLLSGAADVSVSSDDLDYSLRVRTLALEVEIGLPAWLGPIAKLRIPVLHRERLTFLWNEPPMSESVVQVLRRPELSEHKGLRDGDLNDARRLIEVRESEDQDSRNRVSQQWSSVLIPGGGGDSFEDLGDRLDDAGTSTEYLLRLNELVKGCGVNVSAIRVAEHFADSTWTSGDKSLVVFVPHGPLSKDAVESVKPRAGIVVLRTRVAPGAVDGRGAPAKVRLVQPEHLLSLIANLVNSRGPGLAPDEIVDSAARIIVSSLEADGWYLYEPGAIGFPPPFDGELPPLEALVEAPSADDTTLE